MTNTIPTFDPKDYVSAIQNHMQWMQLGEGLKKSPFDPQLRQVIGATSHYANPSVFIGESPDVVQAYADGNIADYLEKVRETTVNHSKRILTDIVDGFDNAGQSVDLILGTGLMPYKGDDKYASITDAHESVVVADNIIQSKNIGAAAVDIVKEYDLGQGVAGAVQYHAGANPEGLLRIYANTVFDAKVQKFAQEFARKKDGELKKSQLANYANYVFKNAQDQAMPAMGIAALAQKAYK